MLLLRAAIGLLLTALGLIWLSTERTVTLVVEGDPMRMRTHAATVGDFVDRAELAAPHTQVRPAPDTPLVDGMIVRVADGLGTAASGWRTVATTLEPWAEAIPSEGRRPLPQRGTRLRRAGGSERSLTPPRTLAIIQDGVRRVATLRAATVAEALVRMGIDVGARDRVDPAPSTPVEHNLEVVLQRVTVEPEVRQEAIPFPTEQQETADLVQGLTRELQAGREGVLQITDEVTRVDGVEESRQRVSDEVLQPAVPRVIAVGTAPPPEPEPPPEPVEPEPAAQPAEPEPDPASEPASATAESTEPTTAEPDHEPVPEAPPQPEPAPEEPPAPANVEEGDASWYDNPYGGYTGAHKTLPRGTIVTVTNLANGRSVQVRINDRGPYVAGRVIDLNRAAFAELASPSAGVIRVRITW